MKMHFFAKAAAVAGTAALLLGPILGLAEDVTIKNLVRAESDTMIRANMAAYNIGLGQLIHERAAVSAESPQPIIRANQGTLYSAVMLDVSEPAKITLPDAATPRHCLRR